MAPDTSCCSSSSGIVCDADDMRMSVEAELLSACDERDWRDELVEMACPEIGPTMRA